MSAHRTPRWTPAEVADLRRVFPEGGTKAALEALPHRSWYSIQVKASKLGLKKNNPNWGGRGLTVAGAELEEAIRLREQGWGFGRIGAHLGRAEASVTNAVLIALCTRLGHTPAERDANGRLTEAGIERIRLGLRRGLKGMEIQLLLGVSAATVALQRRIYNADLKARGKRPLPPPNGGKSYSGQKVSTANKKRAEQLFLEGYGNQKVSQLSGVSKTVCTRIRNKLIRRLKRNGECLPGCDINGKRQGRLKDSLHYNHPKQLEKMEALLLARWSVVQASLYVGMSRSCADKHIQRRIAEGAAFLTPLRSFRRPTFRAAPIPKAKLSRFRDLLRDHSLDDARHMVLAEVAAEAKERAQARSAEILSFEDQLERVRSGKATVAPVFRPKRIEPDFTLGGVATGAF